MGCGGVRLVMPVHQYCLVAKFDGFNIILSCFSMDASVKTCGSAFVRSHPQQDERKLSGDIHAGQVPNYRNRQSLGNSITGPQHSHFKRLSS